MYLFVRLRHAIKRSDRYKRTLKAREMANVKGRTTPLTTQTHHSHPHPIRHNNNCWIFGFIFALFLWIHRWLQAWPQPSVHCMCSPFFPYLLALTEQPSTWTKRVSLVDVERKTSFQPRWRTATHSCSCRLSHPSYPQSQRQWSRWGSLCQPSSTPRSRDACTGSIT